MSANKVLKYNALFLGTVMFIFGFLKFFDPINTWFHVQISKSGLPALSIPVGIAAEMSIGLSLVLASYFRQKIGSLFKPIVSVASAGLIFNMAVAVYVHLQPKVPADVLPFGIKPPFIPLIVMLLAVLNLIELHRTHDNAPLAQGCSLDARVCQDSWFPRG